MVVDTNILNAHAKEVSSGERFSFGDNWANFLDVLDEVRIQNAVASLKKMLEVETLKGKSFLDAGSGSGLFSLAAKRLGARVISFDYDPQSVACTKELKHRYFENDDDWKIQTGSVLDKNFLNGLGKFDVVYSWGVLHHTGDMWSAIANVDSNVAENGKLFIALYNDQGGASRRWAAIKKMYNRLPGGLKNIFAVAVYLPLEVRSFLIHLIRRQPKVYFDYIRNYSVNRGMSWWYDKIDWIGGYPFEVSKPEQVFYFYKDRGYSLLQLVTNAGGMACNEFVFQKIK
ncbi:class I SAM-dependent methyltransferase [Chitinivorax sp. B]|uniref:class I SAM-dependent methyltransferase n=1 Tax=Chitinivorax sp. B TaxID=2502235 RepID=UPI0010F708C5|nr:class I SAM-dependent methyltransferase [Chitinivorax sp. B]